MEGIGMGNHRKAIKGFSALYIKEQIDEMYKQNILGVYVIPHSKKFRPNTMVTNLQPEYLSDEYFRLCAYAFEQGKKLGMNCWIYDEGGWPSGSACGKVIKNQEIVDDILKKGDKYF